MSKAKNSPRGNKSQPYIISVPNYVYLAAPELEVLRIIGVESKRKGTSKLSSRQIDKIIQLARASTFRRK